MKISSIETGLYRVPLRNVHQDAMHGDMHQIELIVVEMAIDNGILATGYAYTIGRGGMAIKALIDEDLSGLLIGEDPRKVEALWDRMWWTIHWVGRGGLASSAIAALDIALWDAIAKHAGEPLSNLLGLYRDKVPVYGSGVDLSLGVDALAEEACRFVEQGFRAVKIKVGKDDLEEDIGRVRSVRQALDRISTGRHGRITLMVDANMKWDVPTAIRAGREFQRLGVLWLEEPLNPDDIEGHREVARCLDMAVAAGENLHSKYEFRNYITSQAVDIVQPDVVTVGGITEWLKVAAIAEAWGLPVSSHYVDEIHVHLLGSIPNAMFVEHHAYRLDDFLVEPFTPRDGYLEVPERPGHGVEFRKDMLDRYRLE